MNYAWDLAIRAEAQGIPISVLRFVPEFPISPYSEIGFKNMNEQIVTDQTIEINGLYRYMSIFETMMNEDMEAQPELRAALFDILTHYLIQLDLRQGLSKQEYYQLFMQEDLETGIFGKQNKDILACFVKKQRQQILIYLVRMYRLGPSQLLLRSVMKEVFPHSITYFSTDSGQELLVFIGHHETPKFKRQVDFICSAFLPLDYRIELFWDKHFGIIGIDETMVPDEIMLF